MNSLALARFRPWLAATLAAAATCASAQAPDQTYEGSVGETMDPPQNYSVVPPDAPDHEPAHNARVSEPYKALVPKLDPTVPANVRPHSRDVLTDIEDRPFFDYNGWQTFVGLIWPADPNMRGVPDATVTAENFAKFNTGEGETTPVVFETLLSSDTLFPSAADAASIPEQPPEWFSTTYSRPFDLTATSKAGALDEAFSNPLIDQNQQYVRYSVQVNRVFYEFIRQNGYYWKGNLPKSPSPVGIPPLDVSMAASDPKTEMPVVPLTQILQPQTNTTVIQPVNGNSITLKTAWRIMIEDDDPDRPWRKRDDLSRYYTAMAHVQNAVTGEREEKLVGLVGMHVVVRTTQFPQGLWSTFGHVDNLVTPPGGRASFKSDDSFYPSGFSYAPDASVFYPETARTPVEVSRIWKIPETPVAAPSNLPHGASTVGLNQSYKELFAGTVWQYYQLEVTQWPTDPGVFYASPFLYPRGLGERPDPSQPPAVHQAYERARANAAAAYPRWSGLPIPQVGALNPVMETYFQNPPYAQPLENTSCMGCHYGASDLGYVWVFKLGAWPPPYNQGRVNPEDSVKAAMPANTE